MIVDFSELKEIKKQKETVVMQFLTNYYRDLQISSGKIDIPYFLKAKQTYNELVHSQKDLNIFYERIIKCQKIVNRK